jgi:hypothetical protein
MLTPGQAHDLVCAEPLIENVEPDALLGDKAFDSDSFIGTLNQREITPVYSAEGQPQDQAGLRFCALLRAQPR